MSELCERWRIATLEAYGSVLRSDFNSGSDIDLLVTFEHDAAPPDYGLMEAEQDFERLLGRKVDLIPRDRLKWVIKDRVLREARPVFSSR